MSVTLKKRLKLVWLAWTKPHLFRPAITLNSAMINGKEECELTIGYTDGRKEVVSYKIIATRTSETDGVKA